MPRETETNLQARCIYLDSFYQSIHFPQTPVRCPFFSMSLRLCNPHHHLYKLGLMLPDKSCYFFRTYYIPGTMLCISHAVLLIFTTTLHISTLTLRRGKLRAQGHNTGLSWKPRTDSPVCVSYTTFCWEVFEKDDSFWCNFALWSF